jgi:hypothetical protein
VPPSSGRQESLIYEQGNTLFFRSVLRLLITTKVVPSSSIIVTLMTEAIQSSKHRYLQKPHGATTAVRRVAAGGRPCDLSATEGTFSQFAVT